MRLQAAAAAPRRPSVRQGRAAGDLALRPVAAAGSGPAKASRCGCCPISSRSPAMPCSALGRPPRPDGHPLPEKARRRPRVPRAARIPPGRFLCSQIDWKATARWQKAISCAIRRGAQPADRAAARLRPKAARPGRRPLPFRPLLERRPAARLGSPPPRRPGRPRDRSAASTATCRRSKAGEAWPPWSARSTTSSRPSSPPTTTPPPPTCSPGSAAPWWWCSPTCATKTSTSCSPP